MASSIRAALESRIVSRQACIGIVGLGYVGLPSAVAFASAGYRVAGVDTDAESVLQIRTGSSCVPEVPSTVLERLVVATAGRGSTLTATSAYAELQSADVMQICVPTPSTRNREPDTRHIREAAEGIAAHGRDGRLVILRTTSYPGTTRELVGPILESVGRVLGRDVFLAFVPERIDPRRHDPPPHRVPLVVGGVDSAATQLACAPFSQSVERIVPVSSPDAAEMAKLLETSSGT